MKYATILNENGLCKHYVFTFYMHTFYYTLYMHTKIELIVFFFSLLFSVGDVIIQQFIDFLSAENETLLSYRPTETRLDKFLHGILAKRNAELWGFCKNCFYSPMGRLQWREDSPLTKKWRPTVFRRRQWSRIDWYVIMSTSVGGLLNVPISKDLLASAASARSKYRMHLGQQKAKKITDLQAQKWKALEEKTSRT